MILEFQGDAMRRLLTSLIIGFAVSVAGTAQAASTSIWDFTGGGGLSNPTSFDDGNGNTVKAYAFTQIDIVNDLFYGTSGVTLTQDGGGLGVLNDLESILESPNVDNTILRDILVFEFDSSLWSPVSISFTGVDSNDTADVYGWNGSLDLPFGIDSSNILPWTLLSYSPDGSGLFGEFDPDGTATIGFDLAQTFQYIAVAGPQGFITNGAFADNFRVSGLTGTVVPVPPALILMLTAIGGLGLISRRREKRLA